MPRHARCRAGICLAAIGVSQEGLQILLIKRANMNTQSVILRNRIKFAVRRCTGRLVDMEAMLGRPELRVPRIHAWRLIGSPELNALLDQLESEFAMDAEYAGARKPAHKVLRGVELVPHM